MNKTLKKIIATVLLTCMISANLSIIGEYGISYALSESELSNQKTTTQNENVEFNSYFEGGVHSKTEKLENTTKLFVNIKVKNAGYLENPVISFSDVNFKIVGEVNNENIQSISENKITLNKLNNGTDLTLEIPVKVLNEDEVALDNFEKETKTNFTATYIDANGKSNEISKQVVNKLLWDGTEGTEGILKTDVTKKIPYHIGEKYGVLLQFYIESGIKDSKLPIKTTQIDVTVPTLNNIKPTSANVIATNTKATNGETNVTNFTSNNYNYNSTTGVLTINTKNKQDKISWVKNVKDRYLVTFIFDVKEAYDYVINNTSKIEVGISAKSEIEVYNGQKTIVKNNAEKSFSYTAGEGATVSMPTEGKMIDFDIKTISEMAKGQIYANYEAKNKNETTYNINYYATVCNAELTDKVEFTQEIDQFLTEENTKNATTVAGNNYTYNKIVKINKDIFKKILGEDGSIKLANSDGTEIATIDKDTTVSEEKYTIDISEKNNNQLLITTSKPVAEGILTIEVEKAVKTNVDYTSNQMKNFKKLTTGITAKVDEKEINATKEITLTEPKSEVLFEVNKEELTTVVENENVELRMVLNISDTTKALYKNPTFKIKLPSYISKCDLNSYDILMGNGLKIKSAKTATENGQIVINVELEGTQTEYLIDAQYKGSIITLMTNIKVDPLTPTNASTVEVEYTNQNSFDTQENKVTKETIKFVAPEGVVTSNQIENYIENGNLQTISSDKTEVELNTYAKARVATIRGKVINNYQNKIKDIVILGRIPATDTNEIDNQQSLNATFDSKLKDEIKLDGVDATKYTVYYSKNGAANKDITNSENGWSTEFNAASKSYLIVINDYEMETGKTIEFKYNVEIPANLVYNNQASEMYKVYYNNISAIGIQAESKTSAVMELTTGEGPVLTANLTYNCPIVRQGQVVKMILTLSNSGKKSATNVSVKIPVPTGAKFTKNENLSGFFDEDDIVKTISIKELKPNEKKEVIYYLRINRDMVGEITTKAEITMNEVESKMYSNECKLDVQEGKIILELAGHINTEYVFKKGDVIPYTLYVFNKSNGETLNNVDITIPLPRGTKAKDIAIIKDLATEETSTEGITYDQQNNIINVKFNQMETQKNIQFSIEITDNISTVPVIAQATIDNANIHYSNHSEYKVEELTLEVSALTSTPKVVKEGETIKYNLNIKNTSNIFVGGFTVTDILPDGLSFENAKYIYQGNQVDFEYAKDNKVEIKIARLEPGESVDIEITVKAGLLPNKDDKEVQNKLTIDVDGLDTITTNIVTNIIEYNEQLHKTLEDQDREENPDPDNPNPDKPDPDNPEKLNYKITGTAWVDSNKNGKHDSEEQVLPNMKVMLLSKENNLVVKDETTNENKIVSTDSNGKYEFTNVPKGEYMVIFLYDSSRYTITQYQANGVDESLNSDAIDIYITLNGEKVKVGTTDVIKVQDSNIRDIDIGLYEIQKFDLKLDKYITKITLTTPTIGTKVYDYNNTQMTKIEVLKRNLGKSSIIIEYKIVVTNEGDIAGYVNKVVDYLPKDVIFNSEINKDWYLLDNGNVYNNSLENNKINPGESRELTLIVTKAITENSLGILNNNAEIYECYNELGLADIDSIAGNKAEAEDDMSKADIVLGVVTGKIAIYSSLAIVIVAMISLGIFEIKKRVLNKK